MLDPLLVQVGPRGSLHVFCLVGLPRPLRDGPARSHPAAGHRVLAAPLRGKCCRPSARGTHPVVKTRRASRRTTWWSWTAPSGRPRPERDPNPPVGGHRLPACCPSGPNRRPSLPWHRCSYAGPLLPTRGFVRVPCPMRRLLLTLPLPVARVARSQPKFCTRCLIRRDQGERLIASSLGEVAAAAVALCGLGAELSVPVSLATEVRT